MSSNIKQKIKRRIDIIQSELNENESSVEESFGDIDEKGTNIVVKNLSVF